VYIEKTRYMLPVQIRSVACPFIEVGLDYREKYVQLLFRVQRCPFSGDYIGKSFGAFVFVHC